MNEAVADSVATMMGRHCIPEDVARSEGSWHAELWRRLDDSGFTGIGVAEELGGSGGDLPAAVSAVKAAASYAAPVPLAEHLTAAGWASDACGHPLGPGPVTAPASLVPVPARLAGDADVLIETGFLPRVPWARVCSQVLVPARTGDGILRCALVDIASCAIEYGENLAREPRDDVRLRDVRVPGHQVLTPREGCLDELGQRLTLARAGQIAGAIERVLALTVQYSNEREQFGRPIGRFQAVQQSLAILAAESAAASAAVAGAVAALARPGRSGATGTAEALAVEAASLRVRSAATRACRIAHQVHGALGFTKEHRLHQLTLRLWSWRDEPEPVSVLADRLGSRLAEIGPAGLWPAVTGPEPDGEGPAAR
jgi:acyl-CoA dehydrogenase